MPWKIFIIYDTPFFRREFRRYSHEKCEKTRAGIHNVSVVIDPQVPSEGKVPTSGHPDEEDKNDPRWPKACFCGRPFHPEEAWQINHQPLYRGFPDNQLYALRDPGIIPGAMWDAFWLPPAYAGPDGKRWCVQLPGDTEFLVYGTDSEHHRQWTVTGTAPKFTVSPSINATGVYHGFIQDGIVTEDCEGRLFPNIKRTA